jgi:hypothetical protein
MPMVYLVGMTYMRVAGAHIKRGQLTIMCAFYRKHCYLNTGTMGDYVCFLQEALLLNTQIFARLACCVENNLRFKRPLAQAGEY